MKRLIFEAAMKATPAPSPTIDSWGRWAFAAVIGLRFCVIATTGLGRDEAYYWDWSRHLALSYYDHPPVIAYLIAGSTALFGRTAFAVHLPALVMTAGASWVLLRLARDLFPSRVGIGWLGVLLLNATLHFSTSAITAGPDAPLIFFWSLTTWLLWRGIQGSRAAWYLAGLSAGLGLLSKYHLVLLAPAVLAVLASGPQRVWLRRKEPYAAAAIMLLFSIPILVWNAEHDWVSFWFHLSQRHHPTLKFWNNVWQFWGSQAGLITPFLFWVYLTGLYRSFQKGRAGDLAHWYLFWVSAFILGFFAILSFFIFTMPAWPIAGLVTGMISAADYLLDRPLRFRAWALVPPALASTVWYAQMLYPFLPLPLKWDETTLAHGWEEGGQALRRQVQSMPHPERTFVLTATFQLASHAHFYGGDDLEVLRLSERPDQYDFWRRPLSQLRGEDAVFISNDKFFLNPEGQYPFRECAHADDLKTLRRGGRPGQTFFYWRCYDFQP